MAYLDLQRRRTQIALLMDACRARVPARIGAFPARRLTHRGRLVAVDAQFVYLEMFPQRRPLDPLTERVRVGFQHRGEWFAFAGDLAPGRAAAPLNHRVFVVQLPISVHRRAGRRRGRLALPVRPAVRVELTSMLSALRRFRGVLRDVGPGGLGILCRDRAEAHPRVGEPFRAVFRLGRPMPEFEFAIRLAHLQHEPPDFLRQGWSLLPGDDAWHFHRVLERIARLARPRHPRGTKGAAC